MTPEALLSTLDHSGVSLMLSQGTLKACGESPAVARWLPEVRIHKLSLLDFLIREAQADAFEERAAILEYDGGLSRAEAEAQARALCN